MAKGIPALDRWLPRILRSRRDGDDLINEEMEARPRRVPTDGTASTTLAYPTAHRLLNKREEAILARRARSGDPAARQAMMEANVRLVLSIARRYNCKTLTFEDLVQEGMLGLLEAINKFDANLGNRFSTYATYWIRQAIVRAIEKQDRIIRLPVYGCDAVRKAERAERTLSELLGRTPTPEEIAKETGLPLRLIKNLSQYAQDPLSLDVLVGDSDDTVFADLVVDSEAMDPADTALGAMERDILLEQVESLEPREQLVIQKRFGLKDGKVHTLKEIADQLKMSREGVRHVQLRALRKLREGIGGAGPLTA